MEKRRMKIRKNWKKLKRKEENEKFKVKNDWKQPRTFFLCFSLLGNQWNFFLVYQNGNFHREKAKITLVKIGKSDFTLGKNQKKWLCPPRKISLYLCSRMKNNFLVQIIMHIDFQKFHSQNIKSDIKAYQTLLTQHILVGN